MLRRELGSSPEHVAIIQDGNRRYARSHGDDAPDGHKQGAKTSERVLDWCDESGVEELTLYTFSTENFDRPQEELDPLFDLMEDNLYEFADADRVHESGVRICAIGETERLPARVRDAVDYAEDRTRDYDNFRLNIALAYGGRAELLGAVRDIADDVESGDLSPEDVAAEHVEERLVFPDEPDLLIKTGAERLSDFMIWQSVYSELYFTDVNWRDFRKRDYLRAVLDFQNRQRRFGR
jgi:tritrans,polycis-undecaprenyl-diphosphate synthase [geranylgeranyl-diphosphate specific]